MPLPASVTAVPSVTVWSSPAFAVGGSLSAWMVTATASVALAPPAVTVNSNVNVVSPVNSGAVNVGVTVVAPVNGTVGVPPLRRHE